MRTIVALGFFVLWGLSGISPAVADEVTQEIDRARQYYAQGKLTEARQSLELAAQLVAQQKAKALKAVLPPPFLGWKAEDKPDPAATTIPTGGVLGGVTAARTFTKDKSFCSITVAGDSPLLAMVSMVLANPNFASASGARVQRIAEQRAVITADGEIHIMSANNYLVTVAGDCAEADKIAYAGAVDYAKLAKF